MTAPPKKKSASEPVGELKRIPIIECGEPLVDFLDLEHLDSSFEARETLASVAGIKDYTGSRLQNLALLKYVVATLSKDSTCPS